MADIQIHIGLANPAEPYSGISILWKLVTTFQIRALWYQWWQIMEILPYKILMAFLPYLSCMVILFCPLLKSISTGAALCRPKDSIINSKYLSLASKLNPDLNIYNRIINTKVTRFPGFIKFNNSFLSRSKWRQLTLSKLLNRYMYIKIMAMSYQEVE